MGHYEPEWEHYNPGTDRYITGPMKYVSDESDERKKHEEYERRRKVDEIDRIRSYISAIKRYNDFDAISKAEKVIRDSEYLSDYEKRDLENELDARRKFLDRVEDDRLRSEHEEYQARSEARERRESALIEAKERYRSLSLFRKIKNFKKRPSTISSKQTVEEIDRLYRKR